MPEDAVESRTAPASGFGGSPSLVYAKLTGDSRDRIAEGGRAVKTVPPELARRARGCIMAGGRDGGGDRRRRIAPSFPGDGETASSVRYGMRERITLKTGRREELLDITESVREIAERSGVKNGLVALYAQGATAAIMIQENWDPSVPTDVITLLRQLIPRGVWLHDQVDGNGDAHLKAGLVGPSETIPLMDGVLGLSRWQNVFFCEFDGPRGQREVVVTVLADR